MPRRRSKGVGPRLIAVEGPIGVGKTTFARHLAGSLGARLVLEPVEDNPFLKAFYLDPRKVAFQAQMYFLLSRYQAQLGLSQEELFQKATVTDFVFQKDRLFAATNLDEAELALYDRIYRLLEPRVPAPDLVVLLTASPEVLMERIRSRGRGFERPMTPSYLEAIASAYVEFFARYDRAPVLVLNTSELDIVNREGDVERLVNAVRRHR